MHRAAIVAIALIGATAAGLLGWRYIGQDGGAVRADPDDVALTARGGAVYRQHCAACHGARLEGQPDWRRRRADGRLPAPPHDATGHTWHHPDRQLFDITKHGSAAYAPPGYKTDMRGFGDDLSDRDIWAVLAYIKSQWPESIRARQARIDERSRDRSR